MAVATWSLLTLSLVSLWAVCYGLGISGLQEHRTQARLYADLRERLALATAPYGGAIAPGTPVALIRAPVAGLDAVVVEGTASGELRAGPGHLRNSPLPGQPGTAYVFGRSVTFGAPFRNVASLHRGASITVTTGQGTFRYDVEGVRRAGDPMPAPLTGSAGRLTLVTSEASGWRSGWVADHVVYVDARLHGDPQPAPAARRVHVPLQDTAMRGDRGALPALVVCLAALLAVGVAAVLVRSRWGRWQTWLVAVPVLLAVIWTTTDTAARLVPNLL